MTRGYRGRGWRSNPVPEDPSAEGKVEVGGMLWCRLVQIETSNASYNNTNKLQRVLYCQTTKLTGKVIDEY